MKFYCDECKKFVEITVSGPIPTTLDVETMYSIFCNDNGHYIARIDDDFADVIGEVLLQ